jgi:hypothetical protein
MPDPMPDHPPDRAFSDLPDFHQDFPPSLTMNQLAARHLMETKMRDWIYPMAFEIGRVLLFFAAGAALAVGMLGLR